MDHSWAQAHNPGPARSQSQGVFQSRSHWWIRREWVGRSRNKEVWLQSQWIVTSLSNLTPPGLVHFLTFKEWSRKQEKTRMTTSKTLLITRVANLNSEIAELAIPENLRKHFDKSTDRFGVFPKWEKASYDISYSAEGGGSISRSRQYWMYCCLHFAKARSWGDEVPKFTHHHSIVPAKILRLLFARPPTKVASTGSVVDILLKIFSSPTTYQSRFARKTRLSVGSRVVGRLLLWQRSRSWIESNRVLEIGGRPRTPMSMLALSRSTPK